MVEQQPSMDRVFRALADPTRRDMLRRLSTETLSVGELAEPCEMSLAAASKHIRMLERAGLVSRRIVGRTHRVQLEPESLGRAHAWLGHYKRFWSDRLDALERALRETETDGGNGNEP